MKKKEAQIPVTLRYTKEEHASVAEKARLEGMKVAAYAKRASIILAPIKQENRE